MKALALINRVCFGAAMLSVVAGAFVTIAAIWLEAHEVGWKAVATTGVLLFSSVLIAVINAVLGTRLFGEEHGAAHARPKGFTPPARPAPNDTA